MAPLPPPEAERPGTPAEQLEGAGTMLKPRAVRVDGRIGRSLGKVAPHARRAGDRMRGVPAVAQSLDAVAGVWSRLVEAFSQTIEPLLARRFPEQRLIAVADTDGALALHRVGRDGTVTLGDFAALPPEALAGLAATRWSALELRLPASQILERKLSLPAASREYLAPILEHRLDRLTPWRPDKVLYGFSTTADTAAASSVAVTLTATSRDLVAAPLQRLGAVGLVPTAIGADSGPADRPMAVNLLAGGAAMPPRAESRRFVSRAALAIGAVLLVACLGTAILAAVTTGAQDASTVKLTKARRLLRIATLGTAGSREQALLEAKQPARATVVLVDKLATSIPTDTYLKELTIQPDKVRLVGSSSDAPALIGRLEAAGLSNVRFTSTIARDKAGRDDFELSADRPQFKPEEAP